MKKLLLIGALLLAACGSDIAQQAQLVTTSYTGAAHVEKAVLDSGLLKECAEAKLKIADNVAFGYVEGVNLTAQQWADSKTTDEQKALEQSFIHLKAGADAAIANLGALTSKPEDC